MRKILLVCFAALLLFSACAALPERVEEDAEPAADTDTAAKIPPTLPPVTPPAASPGPAETAPPPTPSPVPVETAAPAVSPDPAVTAPEVTEPLEDAAFADAAFFGNSLVDGLRMFGGLKQGEFFAMESASVVNVGKVKNAVLSDGEDATLIEALCEGAHGKIYVLLGINEISFAPEYFARLYGGVLDAIQEREPDAEIYVMSLTPVTKAKNDEGAYFTMAAVNSYNDALRALAEERGFHYIDLVDALAGEDGFLPEEDSTDGIHLTREKYPVWAEYLRTHG